MAEKEFKYSNYKKYLADQSWRLNHLYRIVNTSGRDIPFKMNASQQILFKRLWWMNTVLKSRQHGITTFACLYFLDTCLFRRDTTACVIAHTKEDAESFFFRNIRSGYDKLPGELKRAIKLDKETERQLRFSNGSSIKVTTSGRSGVYQLMHISELGKICAKFPDKAREINTGSLQAVHAKKSVVIAESTAEGKEGLFFDICKKAQDLQLEKKTLTPLDFKFFFFAWFHHPENRLKANLEITPAQMEYFEKIMREADVTLDREQMNWHIKKMELLGEDMKQEHPSTPEEAFEASVQGIFYASQFTKIRKENRICKVPIQDGLLVDTWWDLGYDDSTSIWFTQNAGRELHVVDYYENNMEGLAHYVDVLRARGYRYGVHTAPHDIDVHELSTGRTRRAAALELGIQFNVAQKTSLQAGIEAVRSLLAICWFDEGRTAEGIKALENYRKEWNDKLGVYRKTPIHDKYSHGADAFRTLAVAHSFTAYAGGRSWVDPEVYKRSRARANPKGWAA